MDGGRLSACVMPIKNPPEGAGGWREVDDLGNL